MLHGITLLLATAVGAAPVDTVAIRGALAPGKWNSSEGVYKVSFPRMDVEIKVDGRKLDPFLGLTSWVSFREGVKKPSMLMGDLVLFEEEVNPVMSVAFESSLEVTALHNHFFFDDPKVYFMHVAGEDSTEKLARAVKKCLVKVSEIRRQSKQPRKSFGLPAPAENSISGAPLDSILGAKGESKEGMHKIVIGRDIKMSCGCPAGKDMGVNTWMAFSGTASDARVDGDFAVKEDEISKVLRTLRGGGINVVAIHHHMVGENPRMLFIHYWGIGPAVELAKTLKSALEKLKD